MNIGKTVVAMVILSCGTALAQEVEYHTVFDSSEEQWVKAEAQRLLKEQPWLGAPDCKESFEAYVKPGDGRGNISWHLGPLGDVRIDGSDPHGSLRVRLENEAEGCRTPIYPDAYVTDRYGNAIGEVWIHD